MTTSVRKMDQLLVNVLGFARRTGRRQIYILELDGRQVVRTLISHGAREISVVRQSRVIRVKQIKHQEHQRPPFISTKMRSGSGC